MPWPYLDHSDTLVSPFTLTQCVPPPCEKSYAPDCKKPIQSSVWSNLHQRRYCWIFEFLTLTLWRFGPLYLQATATHGPVVERARAWCQMVGLPYYRFSSPMSHDVGLDETDDRVLVQMLWETRVYVLQHFKEFTDLANKLTSWHNAIFKWTYFPWQY